MRRTPEEWDEVFEWRLNFALEIGQCEKCHRNILAHLQVHEITNGHARQGALTDRRCILVTCAYCHAWLHRQGQRGKLMALAYLMLRRPDDFDLDIIHHRRGDRWPDPQEVGEEALRIYFEEHPDGVLPPQQPNPMAS